MTTPRPADAVPGRGDAPDLDASLTLDRDPAVLAELAPGTVLVVETTHGTVSLQDDVLVLTGEVDRDLVGAWNQRRPEGLAIAAVDARRVTHLGSEGLALLAGVARHTPGPLPLWATQRVVLQPLRLVGLDRLFDLHDPSSPTG